MLNMFLRTLLSAAFFFPLVIECEEYIPKMDITEKQFIDPLSGNKINILEIQTYPEKGAEEESHSSDIAYEIPSSFSGEQYTFTTENPEMREEESEEFNPDATVFEDTYLEPIEYFQFSPDTILPEQVIIEQIPVAPDTFIVQPNFSNNSPHTQRDAFFRTLKEINNANNKGVTIVDTQESYHSPSFQSFDQSFIPPQSFDRGAQYLRQAAEFIELNAPNTPVALFLQDAQGQWIPIPHDPNQLSSHLKSFQYSSI